jgi:hypothetical protein
MDEQITKIPAKSNKFQNFNFALFLGCCMVALSIFIAGLLIARQLPDSLHGNFHGSFSGTLTDSGSSFREFMSEWEAANFLMMSQAELEVIIESGELRGTYTVFQVERNVLRDPERSGEWAIGGNFAEIEMPRRVEFDTILACQRVFSRERLSEWLLGRIDAQ